MGAIGDVVGDVVDKALGPVDDAIKAGASAIGELAQGDLGGAAKAIGKGLVDAGTDFLPPGISNVAKQFGNKFIDSLGGKAGTPQPQTPNLGSGPGGANQLPSVSAPGSEGVHGQSPTDISGACTGKPNAARQMLERLADDVQNERQDFDMGRNGDQQLMNELQQFDDAAQLMQRRGLISQDAANQILASHMR